LREDVHFFGQDRGWGLRYRLNERTLFIVRVLPAALEAALELDSAEREALLKSRWLSRKARTLLEAGPDRNGPMQMRMALRSSADLDALLQLVEARIRALT
jgi:hypothetical protein